MQENAKLCVYCFFVSVFINLYERKFCRAMDFIMDHVSRKVGIQVGLHTFTDIDYADDVTLFVDTQDKYPIALSAMDEEAS